MKRLIEFIVCKQHRLMQGWWREQGGKTARVALKSCLAPFISFIARRRDNPRSRPSACFGLRWLLVDQAVLLGKETEENQENVAPSELIQGVNE